MKRFYILVMMVMLSMMASAQFAVSSFEHDEGDMTARVNAKQDNNGQWCALLKITTKGINEEMRQKFTFGADMGTQLVETTFPTGAIWIYLSPGMPTLLIKHPDLGIVNYDVKINLEPKNTYAMTLELASATLIIRCTPSDADIYVDDVKIGQGEINMPVTAGVEHRWLIDNKFYYKKSGTVKINEKETKTLTENLEPAYGYIKINTTPENGATVVIDGEEMSMKTPFLSDKITRGDHRIEVRKALYTTYSDIVFIDNGKREEINVAMQPNYAELSVTTGTDAEIWVNGERKSMGSWSGLVDAGTCKVEARKTGYVPVERTMILELKETKTVSLNTPTIRTSSSAGNNNTNTNYTNNTNYSNNYYNSQNTFTDAEKAKLSPTRYRGWALTPKLSASLQLDYRIQADVAFMFGPKVGLGAGAGYILNSNKGIKALGIYGDFKWYWSKKKFSIFTDINLGYYISLKSDYYYYSGYYGYGEYQEWYSYSNRNEYSGFYYTFSLGFNYKHSNFSLIVGRGHTNTYTHSGNYYAYTVDNKYFIGAAYSYIIPFRKRPF